MIGKIFETPSRLALVNSQDILTSTAMEFGEAGRALWEHYAHTNPILARELLARALTSVGTLTGELVPRAEDMEFATVIVNQALFTLAALELATRRTELGALELDTNGQASEQLVLFEIGEHETQQPGNVTPPAVAA